MSDALGIDTGSYKTVLGCVKKRGIEIVLSETSSKSTPTLAAFTPEERLIGDSAGNQMKKNFKNTLQFFSRFLGLNQDCAEQLEEEKKFTTYKTVNLENKKLGFEVLCRGEKLTLTPEQVMAFYLKRAKTYFEKADDPMMSKEIVLSVPTYASNAERQAYLDAAEIAGIKCVKLMNESTAIALNYGFFRQADLKTQARTVCFVDFGHSKLSVFFAHFKGSKCKILSTHSHRNLGARQIDYLLFDLFASEFAKKHGCDPRDSARPRLRMLDQIEKTRKLLTLNREADCSCECLMEDEDFHKSFKREELEALIAPFLERFKATLGEALTKSGLTADKIDAVELVGDSTRMPAIQAAVREALGKEELQRTLNSQETVARGCALQAAMLSPNFSVTNFEIEEYNEHQVNIQYRFKSAEKVSVKELFKVGGNFPSTKTITFENKLGGVDLLVNYADTAEVLAGLPKQIAQYQIPEGTLSKDKSIEKFAFIMRVTNNIHNVAALDDAELKQQWTEEEKIAVKASPIVPPKPEEKKDGAVPADGAEKPAEEPKPVPPPVQPEQKYEIKKRSKETYAKLKFTTSNFALAPTLRAQFRDAEDALTKGDRDIFDAKDTKNQLETYCYNMRQELDSYGSLEKFCDPAVKEKFVGEINQVVEWLYDAGESATVEEYRTRLAAFKEVGEPVKARAFYYGELPSIEGQFGKATEHIQAKLAAPELTHLTDEQRDTVLKKHEAAQDFFMKVAADRAAKKDFEDPAFKLADLEAQISTLKTETNAIFATPPPKAESPPKEKEDAKMNGDAEKEKENAPDAAPANEDAEMKAEGPEEPEQQPAAEAK